jgi:hypothetical protein
MLVVELGIPELTTEQMEILCATADNAARKHVLSKVASKLVEQLNISVEADGSKPLNVSVEIDIILSSEAESLDARPIVNGAIDEAYNAIENYLRRLK